MCTRKRVIYNSKGRAMYVKCGRCPACLQEKAIARTNRIRNNVSGSITDPYCLFVTLTYENKYVPYFNLNEFRSSEVNDIIFKKHNGELYSSPSRTFNIYRDSLVRYDRSGDVNTYVKHVFPGRRVLTTFTSPVRPCPGGFDYSKQRYPFLRKHVTRDKFIYLKNRVGVCLYSDLQNFFKRLRINLERHGFKNSFSYYACSELGSTSVRPHFHLLLFVSGGSLQYWKNSIVSAWPYADDYRTRDNISVAKNPASYVASYVNCDKTVPALFRDFKEFRPSHSYSQGFGMALQRFSLSEMVKAFYRGDVRYDVLRIRQGTLVVEHQLVPKYAISRYFPKFKGYCNLTPNEIISVFCRPSKIIEFSARNDYTRLDVHNIQTMLNNKRRLALSQGVSLYDYAYVYANIWNLYSSEQMRDFYDRQYSPKDVFEAYDNIFSYLNGSISNDRLDQMIFLLPSNYHIETDPNLFPLNVSQTNRLTQYYDMYSKDKKARSIIYEPLNM